MQNSPMNGFVDAALAHMRLNRLDPQRKTFDVGQGQRGVLHIMTKRAYHSGRLVRPEHTTLCRGAQVREVTQESLEPLTCKRCQEVAGRIIKRRLRQN